MRSDVEETGTQKTKDSGYSNSGNSQSQRSSGSSKSRDSTLSGSSGFRPSQTQGEGDKPKRNKEKKKKDGLQLPDQPEEPRDPGTDLANAALSQTFNTISRLKSPLPPPELEKCTTLGVKTAPRMENEDLARLFWKENIQEEELGIVVSMEDGLVIYTTPTISGMLGYPKDMWVGRSMIDFIHPKHRASFAGHITSVVASKDPGNSENMYLCYLRQYRGLRNAGFSVTDKRVGYLPLQLSMTFKGTEKDSGKLYLVINAILVRSAYTDGEESRVSAKFTTRHTSTSHLCHVDQEVTPYFGYLPQDILGRSILEFYHPEDLHVLKKFYESVMKEQGHLFKSKLFRFRCQNGGFALVETELSSFINPWSRKLEFIICQHTVVRGPPNPDVTSPVFEPEALQISEEVMKESEIVQEEIKSLLNETLVRNPETAKQEITRRCKDLAVFMEKLMDEISRPPNLKVDVPTEEQSLSERDSVMLGEISPHHEYYDSKSSSETPPSYNQLNYNENMQRFFESKPNTSMSQGSSESKVAIGGEERKIPPAKEYVGDSKSGGSGGSSGAQSTESNENSGETNGSNEVSAMNFKATTLTEQRLTRHNEDMEKQMVQKHREQRPKPDTKVKERLKATDKEQCNKQGVKRSGSHLCEGDPHKTTKAKHSGRDLGARHDKPSASFQQKQDFPPGGFANPLLPLYLLANRRPDHSLPLFSQQVPYVSGMMYQPVMFSPQPVVYTPLAVPGAELSHLSPPVSTQLLPPPQATPQMKSLQEHSSGSFCKEPCENLVQDQKTDSNDTSSIPFDDSSSSFYSLLKTDKSDGSLRSSSENETKQEVAPWIEDIKVTPDLILKYQLQERPLADILSQDLKALAFINQPEMVSEQLSQMYLDLERAGVSQQLEVDSSSSDSSSDEPKMFYKHQDKKYMEYDKMVILFEEDAPLPPPILQGCT